MQVSRNRTTSATTSTVPFRKSSSKLQEQKCDESIPQDLDVLNLCEVTDNKLVMTATQMESKMSEEIYTKHK